MQVPHPLQFDPEAYVLDGRFVYASGYSVDVEHDILSPNWRVQLGFIFIDNSTGTLGPRDFSLT